MNVTIKLSAIALLLSTALFSCQKDQALEPQNPTLPNAAARIEADGLNVGFPKKYTLTKHGDATLTYFADGKLKRVAYGNGRLAPVTEYAYGAGWVESSAYADGKLAVKTKYTLDANGRCVESAHDTYSYPGAGFAMVSNKTFKYEYDANGLLKKKYNKANPAERTDYISGGDPDHIHQARSTVSGIEVEVVQYIYGFPGQRVADRNHLNPLAGHVPDEYLRIFGKPTKSLLVGTDVYSWGQATAKWKYENTLNADGYLTVRKEVNTMTNATVSKTFEYQVTFLGVQP